MIEPKLFFRALDAFLLKIAKGEEEKTLLFSVLEEVVRSFGKGLRIGGGKLFQEQEQQFVLRKDLIQKEDVDTLTYLDSTQEAVQLLFQHGSYIYDNPKVAIYPDLKTRPDTTLAAFFLGEVGSRWILVFEVYPDWDKGEIEVCLNIIRRILIDRISSESLKSNLNQAAKIQQSLLPKKFPDFPGYQAAARSIPAELVGGDFYDFIMGDGESLAVAIGDASGHELPAALLVRDVVIGLRVGYDRHLKIAYVLEHLNKVLYRSLSRGFTSLFLCELEKDGSIFYVNAGHPAPLLVQNGKIEKLTIGGTVLGPVADAKYKRGFARIDLKGILILYSDGLIERKNRSGDDFGLERLIQLVLEQKDLNADQILENVFSSIQKFGKGTRWEDDATLVVVKRTG